MPMISLKLLAAFIALLIVATGIYNTFKPLPAGLSRATSPGLLYDVALLTDVSWRHDNGEHRHAHQIFDEIFRLIGQAEQLVVVDMFLFNDTAPDDTFDPLSRKLADALIQRKQAVPGLMVQVITDPINTVYGGTRQPDFERLRAAGIPVTETRLPALRDSNPFWSSIWRVCCQWFGNSTEGGWLPNALGEGKVPLRSYLALANFKANHRKTLIVDEGDQLRGLITSANPHAGSSRHWNTALAFSGPAAADLLETEIAVLAFSGADIPESLNDLVARHATATKNPETGSEEPRGSILTEAAIRDAALTMINNSAAGDQLDLAMFYLSHRELVQALARASRRGAAVRVLLDRNEDAFGHRKNGIPNRQVATELTHAGITVRWCNTHGEQCHNKLLLRHGAQGDSELLIGSANFTRRNLDDLNLETDILVTGPSTRPPFTTTTALFNRLWQVPTGDSTAGVTDIPPKAEFSLPYESSADTSRLRYWRYRFMEASGLSTF